MNAHVAKPVDNEYSCPNNDEMFKRIKQSGDIHQTENYKGADIMKAWERLINYVTVRNAE